MCICKTSIESLTPKHRVAVGILLLCALGLDICLGPFHPTPLQANVAKKPLLGES